MTIEAELSATNVPIKPKEQKGIFFGNSVIKVQICASLEQTRHHVTASQVTRFSQVVAYERSSLGHMVMRKGIQADVESLRQPESVIGTADSG